jgi:hypothetical protein
VFRNTSGHIRYSSTKLCRKFEKYDRILLKCRTTDCCYCVIDRPSGGGWRRVPAGLHETPSACLAAFRSVSVELHVLIWASAFSQISTIPLFPHGRRRPSALSTQRRTCKIVSREHRDSLAVHSPVLLRCSIISSIWSSGLLHSGQDRGDRFAGEVSHATSHPINQGSRHLCRIEKSGVL